MDLYDKAIHYMIVRIFLILAILGIIGVLGTTFKKGSEVYASCRPSDLSGLIDTSSKVAIFEGEDIDVPQVALVETPPLVLGVSNEERWIEVDLSEQKLKAWEGNNLYLETLVSTGLPWWPTPQGTFYIKAKLRATKMEGGSGKHYYYLPNVPYVMYFEGEGISWSRGYGLHGTYWHNSFGTRRSHGCVNLPTPIAEKLYWWTGPIPTGKGTVTSSGDNPGTRIVIHD